MSDQKNPTNAQTDEEGALTRRLTEVQVEAGPLNLAVRHLDVSRLAEASDAEPPSPIDAPPPDVEGPSLRRRSLASEYCEFLMENKKWWMIPIIVVVVVLGLAIMLLGGAGGAVAPFIYALF